MRSLTQALLYPGVGLLETTNLSVGRGTDTPFERLGAPWIDGLRLAHELNAAQVPGVSFVPIEFTPSASKFAGQLCHGVNIHVVQRDAIEPVQMGITIACTLRRLFRDRWDVEALDRLLVNREVYNAILAGATAEQIQRNYRTAIEEFLPLRRQVLLYR